MTHASMQNIAGIYDLLASMVFGSHLQKAQTAYLHHVTPQSSLLIIGGGSGWILKEILKRSSPSSIFYLETSAAMLELARKEWGKIDKKVRGKTAIRFVHGSEEDIPAESKFDAVLTFFLLDCYTTPEAGLLMKKLKNHLRAEGLWLFADFRIDMNSFNRFWQKLFINIMYLFFGLSCGLKNRSLPDLQQLFSDHALQMTENSYFFSGFIQSSIYHC